MSVLELMHSLEEAYERFGDIPIEISIDFVTHNANFIPKDLIIESEEFIIKCE